MSSARSLYLHLPFCSVKCHYCDFVVRVLSKPEQIDRYLEHLELELAALAAHCSELETVYLGGGTPSLLSIVQIKRLGRMLHQHFRLEQVQEWTLEVNPETAETDSLKAWRQIGVNRVSLGVQSFDAALLTSCGRPHGVAEISQAVKTLKQVGLENFSLDLIYGLPEQSLESWKQSLLAAIALAPRHVSLYALEVHEKTHFGHQQLNLPGDELAADMYDLACEALGQAGFVHYEIANWGLPGYHSRHNTVYWQNSPFAAAGVGAHGYLMSQDGPVRYAHPDSLATYYRQSLQSIWPWEQTEAQTQSEQIEETVFLGLRLLEQGIDLDAFEARFGRSLLSYYPRVLPRLLELGQLIKIEQRLRLSPDAVMLSNEIFAEFLDPEL